MPTAKDTSPATGGGIIKEPAPVNGKTRAATAKSTPPKPSAKTEEPEAGRPKRNVKRSNEFRLDFGLVAREEKELKRALQQSILEAKRVRLGSRSASTASNTTTDSGSNQPTPSASSASSWPFPNEGLNPFFSNGSGQGISPAPWIAPTGPPSNPLSHPPPYRRVIPSQRKFASNSYELLLRSPHKILPATIGSTNGSFSLSAITGISSSSVSRKPVTIFPHLPELRLDLMLDYLTHRGRVDLPDHLNLPLLDARAAQHSSSIPSDAANLRHVKAEPKTESNGISKSKASTAGAKSQQSRSKLAPKDRVATQLLQNRRLMLEQQQNKAKEQKKKQTEGAMKIKKSIQTINKSKMKTDSIKNRINQFVNAKSKQLSKDGKEKKKKSTTKSTNGSYSIISPLKKKTSLTNGSTKLTSSTPKGKYNLPTAEKPSKPITIKSKNKQPSNSKLVNGHTTASQKANKSQTTKSFKKVEPQLTRPLKKKRSPIKSPKYVSQSDSSSCSVSSLSDPSEIDIKTNHNGRSIRRSTATATFASNRLAALRSSLSSCASSIASSNSLKFKVAPVKNSPVKPTNVVVKSSVASKLLSQQSNGHKPNKLVKNTVKRTVSLSSSSPSKTPKLNGQKSPEKPKPLTRATNLNSQKSIAQLRQKISEKINAIDREHQLERQRLKKNLPPIESSSSSSSSSTVSDSESEPPAKKPKQSPKTLNIKGAKNGHHSPIANHTKLIANQKLTKSSPPPQLASKMQTRTALSSAKIRTRSHSSSRPKTRASTC